MAVNILQVLRLGAVNVAREVEVEVVLRVADLRQRHHARIPGDFELAVEGIDDLMDVLGAEAVLVPVFDESLGGVDHEDALPGMGVFLVENEDAGGDARAVKEVGRQADDALDIAALDDLAADRGLGTAAEKNAVRVNDRAFACALEAREDVQEESIVAVLLRRNPECKAAIQVIGRIEAVAPGFGGERKIGDDEVEGLEAAVGAFEVRAGEGVVLPYLRRRAVVEDHVHPGQRGGGVVHLLPIEREVEAGTALGFVMRLQKQRAGAAGGIVDGLAGALGAADADHLGHDARDFRRGVELPLALARLGGEVAHQVFVGVAEKVVALGAVAHESRAPGCRRWRQGWRGGPPSPCPCPACPRR